MIIIGGGLAGLTVAIHLAMHDIAVILFEKESYPHHKVCGEYLSKEVLPYLKYLEIPIMENDPVPISRLLYSTKKGKSLSNDLPLGGLGISRFALDTIFYQTARKFGVTVKNEKVVGIEYLNGEHTVQTTQNTYKAKYAVGAYGKRSSLDKELKRGFFLKAAPWVAVKSHYQHDDFPEDLVALHSFHGGYCGLSRTETGAVNVCYLATYESFKSHKNPETFKEEVLRKNPFLDRFFSNATNMFERPLSIAQVSFGQKNMVEDHVLMTGDSAGLIHPLCGNGMAMAIHSGKIASEILLKHLQNKTARKDLEEEYTKAWKRYFRNRMYTGKWLQKILLNESLSAVSQNLLTKMPFLLPAIIKQTHGTPIES